jgi:hypothetical protein
MIEFLLPFALGALVLIALDYWTGGKNDDN